MARLIYSTIASLDGCVADRDGRFDWAAPDEEVHAFVNDLERPIGTYLYGRRMYETMVGWEYVGAIAGDDPSAELDFARLWRAADKIVYSTTLTRPAGARTRIEESFEPEAVRQLKARSERDISIGGPTLAAHAIRAGLVDDFHFFVTPVVVGGGTRSLPEGLRLDLELVDVHRFRSGVVHLHYRAGA
jgi:dihydrofolate reductase